MGAEVPIKALHQGWRAGAECDSGATEEAREAACKERTDRGVYRCGSCGKSEGPPQGLDTPTTPQSLNNASMNVSIEVKQITAEAALEGSMLAIL